MIDTVSLTVSSNISRLRLIGAHDTADRCAELRDAIDSNELIEGLLELDHLERKLGSPQSSNSQASDLARRAELETQFDTLVAKIDTSRNAVGAAIEAELARTNLSTATRPA